MVNKGHISPYCKKTFRLCIRVHCADGKSMQQLSPESFTVHAHILGVETGFEREFGGKRKARKRGFCIDIRPPADPRRNLHILFVKLAF